MIFLGYDMSGIVLFLKILGFVLSVGFAVGLVLSILGQRDLFIKKKNRRENYFNDTLNNSQSSMESREMKRWQNIKAHFQSKNPTDWRMAIIDADAMLEDIIESMGYRGASFGEKLKSMNPRNVPFLNDAWHVHKLRNILAHQGSRYNLSEREAYQAHKIYENIFYSTGYIS